MVGTTSNGTISTVVIKDTIHTTLTSHTQALKKTAPADTSETARINANLALLAVNNVKT